MVFVLFDYKLYDTFLLVIFFCLFCFILFWQAHHCGRYMADELRKQLNLLPDDVESQNDFQSILTKAVREAFVTTGEYSHQSSLLLPTLCNYLDKDVLATSTWVTKSFVKSVNEHIQF